MPQKMDVHGKLSILVQSDRHFDFVEKLTEAALEKGKQVKIHILGDGVAFISSNTFTRLIHMAQISICSDSFNKFFGENIPVLPRTVKIVQPRQITEIVQWCDRNIVF